MQLKPKEPVHCRLSTFRKSFKNLIPVDPAVVAYIQTSGIYKIIPVMYGIEGLPEEAKNAILKSRGRPQKDNNKVSISIRLDADIVKEFRAHGTGWQTEINGVLRQWLENRP